MEKQIIKCVSFYFNRGFKMNKLNSAITFLWYVCETELNVPFTTSNVC